MPFIFHQNMRIFGGGAPGRNAVFNIRFGAINAITGGGYWAAGFTEITNSNPALRNILGGVVGGGLGGGGLGAGGLAQTIDGNLGRFLVLEVGTTALGTREYIGIAWDPLALNVQFAGQVLYNPMTHGWPAYLLTAANFPASRAISLPVGVPLGADTRGVAYIAGLRMVGVMGSPAGSPFVIGFMHNMYNLGDRSSAFSSLNQMMDNLLNAVGGVYAANPAEILIGGDFNIVPRDPKRRRANPMLYGRATTAGGLYVNTTYANPYDFWVVSNVGLTNANTFVHANTRVALASDHAGVRLVRA